MILFSVTLFYNKGNILTMVMADGNNRVFLQPYYKVLASNIIVVLSRISLILLFLFLFFQLVFQLIKKYKNYNNLVAKKLRNWVLILVISLLLVTLQNAFYTLKPDLMFGVWITILVYHLNALVFLYRPDFINRSYLKRKIFETNVEKDEQSALNEEIFFNEFYHKAYFTNPKASLQEFVERLQVTQSELLRFIHVKLGRSFNEILQEKRIELFKELASKIEYKQYTVEGLAKEVGFSSRQSFYLAFKKIDGGLPIDLLY